MIADEQQAIDAALHMARAGDLVLIFADALARGWKQIVNFHPDNVDVAIPAARAARSVPRQEVQDNAPADDAMPAVATSGSSAPPIRWNAVTDVGEILRDSRGVILAPEAND